LQGKDAKLQGKDAKLQGKVAKLQGKVAKLQGKDAKLELADMSRVQFAQKHGTKSQPEEVDQQNQKIKRKAM
jgi:predicted nuclease with TOPRIM domain